MKRHVVSLCIVSLLTSGIYAEPAVAITGRVTNAENKGVHNAVVRMGISGLLTRTNIDGYYAIGEGVSGVRPDASLRGTISEKGPRLFAGKACFSVTNPTSRVTITRYDAAGRMLDQILNRTLTSGIYAQPLDGVSSTSGFHLVRITIDDAAYIFKCPALGSLRAATGNTPAVTRRSGLARRNVVSDTIYVTASGYNLIQQPVEELFGSYNFQFTSKTTTWNGDTAGFWDDSNIPPRHNAIMYKFLNRTNGKYSDSQIYWSLYENGTRYSLADRPTYDMPHMEATRMYFWVGSPDSEYRDFIEQTPENGRWAGNITRVDAYVIPLAVKMRYVQVDPVTQKGDTLNDAVGDAYNLFFQDRTDLWAEFRNEVPREFTGLALTDNESRPFKIIRPGSGITPFAPGGQYEDYYNDYVDQVWARNNITLPKPSTAEIFLCSGALKDESPLLSILNRHVGLLDESGQADPSNYYLAAPANFYSAFFHPRSLQDKAYGYPYDDNHDQASYMAHANPVYMLVAMGY